MQRLNPCCLDVTAKLGLFLLTRSKINVKNISMPPDSHFFKDCLKKWLFFVGHQNLSSLDGKSLKKNHFDPFPMLNVYMNE